MSIAAASAQLLEVDGAERARAGALAPRCGGRGRALHPPSPRLRTSSALGRPGCAGGGMRLAGAGAGECVFIGVWRGKLKLG